MICIHLINAHQSIGIVSFIHFYSCSCGVMSVLEESSELPENVLDFIISNLDAVEDEDGSEEGDWRFENESEDAIKIITAKNVAPNTARKICYVRKLWSEWVFEKNKKLRLSLSKVPEKSIDAFSVEELNTWMPYFIAEIRTQSKKPYQANSILQFVLCLQTHCRLNGKDYKFLVEKRFERIRNALDSVMKLRQKEGRGNNPRKAEIITEDQENFLWNNSILGGDTPKKLVSTLIYVLGVRLMLRSGEHRCLRIDMFRVDEDSFTYTEWSSKNKPGGLVNKNKKPKIVQVLQLQTDDAILRARRCPVVLLKKYLSAIRDKSATENAFYLKPTSDGFANVPLGQHTIEQYAKNIFTTAGFQGYYTLHGLRRTGATRLFQNNIPETVIQSMTGHSSLMSLREYISVPAEMGRVASRSLSALPAPVPETAMSVFDQRASTISTVAVPETAMSIFDARSSTISTVEVPETAMSIFDARSSAISSAVKGRKRKSRKIKVTVEIPGDTDSSD